MWQRLQEPMVIRRALAGLVAATALAVAPMAPATAQADSLKQIGACVATNTRFDFAIYLSEDTGGVHPELARIRSTPGSQFRYVIYEYDGDTVLRTWLRDPSGVTTVDSLPLASAGFTVPRERIRFKVAAYKQTASGGDGGSCWAFTRWAP